MGGQAAYVAVVGAGTDDPELEALAEEVGRRLAAAGATVVCGGLGGVMAAASRGARAAGGTTLGILPGSDRRDANPWVDVAVPTGMGELRNALIVRTVDAVIAIGGGYGTLSEIAFALKTGVAVIGLRTWSLPETRPDPLTRARDPEEAVGRALGAARRR
ncbi:MAG TPA: TIGR00725 family protein [Nitriliruptorales bacterium]|nr:TIGR00725 family protein [Nitriliruptorales bacterium]